MRSYAGTYAITVLASLLCASMSVSTARADDPSAAQKAVEIRQSVLKLMGWNFAATIGPMMANKMKFEAAVAQKDAARLQALAPMIPDAFALDTHQVSGLKTRARADIWTHMADFKAKDDDLLKALTALTGVAKNGDEGAFRQAALLVGDACRACHDSYRDN